MSARRRHVAFVGLCQTEALSRLYAMHIAPFRDERVTYSRVHPWAEEHEAAEHLRRIASADVVVEQRFDSPSRIPDGLLGAHARRLWHPYVHIGFLWPYSTEPHPRNRTFPWLNLGPYGNEVGDRYLNRLIADRVPAAEAVQRYLAHDIIGASHIDRVMELGFELLRAREAGTGIAIADFVERRFRDEQLFFSKGHPAPPIMDRLTAQVFAALDAPAELVAASLRSPVARVAFQSELPHHPKVVAHLGLRFVAASQRYRHLDEGHFTFAEYAARYMNFTWEPRLAEGIARGHGRDDAAAATMLTEALQVCPNATSGWRTLGTVLRRLGRHTEAAAALERAQMLAPDDPATLTAQARLFVATGQPAAAERAATAAIRLAPLAPEAHELMADLNVARGAPAAAAGFAVVAADLAPGNVHGAAKAGRLAMAAGDLASAERLLHRAVAMAPEDCALLALLTDVLVRSDRGAEAAALLGRLADLTPDDARTHARWGTLLIRLGDLDTAEAALRRAVQLDPAEGGAAHALSGLLADSGRPDAAIAVLRDAIAAGGAEAAMQGRLGHLLARTGDFAGAEAALRRILALDPAWPGAINALAGVLARSGRASEAVALLRAAIDGGSGDAHLHMRLGNLLTWARDLVGAEAALRRALDLDPALHDAHVALERVLARRRAA